MNVLAGEVIAHSVSRERVYQAFALRQGRDVAVEYTGSIPENIAYVL